MSKRATRFAIVGPGRVGSSIAKALSEKGWACSSIMCKDAAPGEVRELRAIFPHSEVVTSLSGLKPEFDVLFVTVRDDQIGDIASDLSSMENFDWQGKVVFHASGVIEVRELSKLRKRGASVGAFHPVSPFADKFLSERAEGIYYDFLGDKKALDIAKKITRALGSKLMTLKSERERSLLHIASVLASNSTVIAVRSAEKLVSNFVKSKDSKSILNNLLVSTVQNLSTRKEMDALTGPLVRGDVKVIAKHIKALENNRSVLQLYKSSSLLGIEALLKHERSRSRRTNLKKIKRLLEVE